ncbi:MAG TPA: hypothetical protein VGS28_02100 [Candidatus Saccharimonadales bacterium]|nr:hypothetical protein [Candidatus Saccharimonadales bacterium]
MLGIITFSLIFIIAIVAVIWGLRRSPKTSPKEQNGLFRGMAVRMVVALIVQFFVGLTVNLWVTVPKSHPGAKSSDYFAGVYNGVQWALAHSGIGFLALHVLIAILLIIFSTAFLIAAILKQNRFWIKAFALGDFFIMLAFFNGASFLNYGEQFSSLLMEIFFVCSISTFLATLYITKPAQKPGSKKTNWI